jgi:plastocyanin
MPTPHCGASSRETGRLIGLALLLLGLPGFAAAQSGAASISGTVRVLYKGGASERKSFANAVVWLSGPAGAPSATPALVNQHKKKFHPRVLPAVKGQVVHFVNQDKIEHNVFSRDSRLPFDLGRYPKSEYRSVTFGESGVFKVYCDIHKAMILDVVVVDSPYYAVSNDQGVFSIEGVPAGSYELEVWHIYGGRHTLDITLGEDPVVLEPITVTNTIVTRDITEHLNKQGRAYPKSFYEKRRRR